jgi:hypothetical protein
MDDDTRFDELGAGTPGDDEHADASGIEVDEPLEIESIELDDTSDPFLNRLRPSAGQSEPQGDAGNYLERLEEEHLALAAELARLRADATMREEMLADELKRLREQLAEREQELSEQVAQIASLTLACDGLRSGLAERQEGHGSSESSGTASLGHDAAADAVASLKARLEERANALRVSREEAAQLRGERDRLAEALAERGEQVAQLLGQVTRAEVRSGFGMDFRSSLRRLLGREVATGAAGDGSAAGSPEEPTIVVGEGAPRPAAASLPLAIREAAVAQTIRQAKRRRSGQQRSLHRFLMSLEQGRGEFFELRKPRCYVGRGAEADVRIVHETVSRLHAVLYQLGGATILEDACSMNGVFVNRQRVRQAVLKDGDTVAFGSARFQFRIGSDPSHDN